MKNSKVLVLTSSFPENSRKSIGGGTFVLKLCKKIKNNNEPIILAPKFYESKKFEYINNLQIHRFGFLPFKNLYKYFDNGIFSGFKNNIFLIPFIPVFLISQFINAIKIIKNNKIKIIHAHWIFPQGFTAILIKYFLKNNDIKVMVTSHGGDIFGIQLLNILKKYIINRSDYITVVSNYIKDFINNKFNVNTKISVVPMGIDIDLFHPDKKNNNIKEKLSINGTFLLFVGRFSEKKGIEYLIKALPQILNYDNKTKLVLIGEGNIKNNLKELVKNLNIENNVIFLGYKSHQEVASFYATADIFIGPSTIAEDGDSEGFGLVFAEAASSECIVVTTDFPAMKDIIIDGETGYTVKQKDPESIAKKVIFLLRNRDSWETIQKKARQHVVKNFSWEKIGKGYSSILYGL